jgi:hypothetical protein
VLLLRAYRLHRRYLGDGAPELLEPRSARLENNNACVVHNRCIPKRCVYDRPPKVTVSFLPNDRVLNK